VAEEADSARQERRPSGGGSDRTTGSEPPAGVGESPARRRNQGITERLIVWLAACVCLLQVAALRDVPAGWAPQAWAPSLPASVGSRDGELELGVTDSEGGAAKGVLVRAFAIIDGRAYLAGQGTTGADGKVVLGQLPPGETWVIAERKGLARSSSRVVLEPGRRRLDLQLHPAESFEVVVVDPLQRPIRGVQVTLHGADPLPFRGQTDDRGLVRITGLGPAPYAIDIEATGFDSKFLPKLELIDSPVFIKLERLGALEITVLEPGGTPAVGATVLVAGSSLWPARSAATDQAGMVTIAGLSRGFYDVRAERGDLVSDTETGVLLERGEVKHVTLGLVVGVFVTVTVTEGEGDGRPPVPKADVALVEGGLSSFPRYGRTDGAGVVVLGPIAGTDATLSARAEGFVARSAVPLEEGATEATIALLRGGKLIGTVVDERDFPIDGVSLEVVGIDSVGMPIVESSTLSAFRDDHFAFALPGATPLIPVGELGVMPTIPDVPREFGPLVVTSTQRTGTPWVSGSKGTFTLTPVTPGRLRVVAHHPSYVAAVSDAVNLESGATQELRIVMRRGGILEGRVLEQDRSPVSGARVEVVSPAGSVQRVTYAADDGRFAFAALPAEVILSIARPASPEHIVERLVIDIPPDQRREIEVILPKKREPVALRVVDDRGYPLDRVEVHCSSLAPREPLVKTLFTDDQGEASLPGARDLPIRFVVLRRDKAPGVFEIDPTPAQLDLPMMPALSAEGRIVTRRGGLAGAKLTLLTPTGKRRGRSDDDGKFRFEGLAPSTAVLLVVATGYVPDEREVLIEGDERRPVDLGTIELSAGGSASGVVEDEDGDPVVGARVAPGRVPTYLPLGPLPIGVTATDAQGRFTLSDLPSGSTDLQAYKVGYGRESVDNVVIRAGEVTKGVRIELVQDPDIDITGGHARGSLAVTLSENVVGKGRAVIFEHVPLGGEAQRAGILAGDRFVSHDGVPIRSLEHARRLLNGALTEDFVVELERGEALRWRVRVRRERVRR